MKSTQKAQAKPATTESMDAPMGATAPAIELAGQVTQIVEESIANPEAEATLTHGLDTDQIKYIETIVEKASAVHKEIDAEQAKTAIKVVWQGCLLFVADEALAAIKDKKVRDEFFDKLLEKHGIARATANQRILLVKRMREKQAISRTLLAHAEEDDHASPEVLPILDKVCGNAKAVDLQREFGIRQPLKNPHKSTSFAKTAVQRLDEKIDRLKKLLSQIGEILKGSENTDEVKEFVRKVNNELERTIIEFQQTVSTTVPDLPHVVEDSAALAAINQSDEETSLVTA